MLKEAKKAMRVTVDNYDDEIMRLCQAGYDDLKIAGVIETGTVTDPLTQRAIITYAAMRFGNPPNYEQLKEAYETQKVQLMHATGHTDYQDGESE